MCTRWTSVGVLNGCPASAVFRRCPERTRRQPAAAANSPPPPAGRSSVARHSVPAAPPRWPALSHEGPDAAGPRTRTTPPPLPFEGPPAKT